MARKTVKEEEEFIPDMEAVSEAAHADDYRQAPQTEEVERGSVKRRKTVEVDEEELINCLRNEEITVRHIQQQGMISDPRHVLSGGMAETAVNIFSVPRLSRSGNFVNVLTNAEMKYLEYALGLEDGALSVYKRKDNFWDNSTEGGISKVRLTKYDTILHLNDPTEYIMYKILLANKEEICPNLETLRDKNRASYRYVLISNQNASAAARQKMSEKTRCYIEYGKIEDNWELLCAIVEQLTGKPVSKNTTLGFLQSACGDLIDENYRLFYSAITDKLLPTKVLIRKCLENGFITKKGSYYYLARTKTSDEMPLCEGGEEPTYLNAAKYLNNPKRQELKLSLMERCEMSI